MESLNFSNEPRLTGHEADKEFDERRKLFASKIQNFVSGHDLFEGKSVEVTFSHSGISSLVSILDTGEKKYVLKMPLKVGFSRSEPVFLQAWEQVGVSVPHVIEVGEIAGSPYILMDYVDALPLRHAYTVEELIENKIYAEMGSTLRKMHTATATGYGDLVDGKAEFANIREWLENSTLRSKHQYVIEHNLLNDTEHGPFEDSLETIFTKIGTDTNTVYGHSDFSIGNIFGTKPLTVFDPIPFLNHPYMDLAMTLTLAARTGLIESHQQIVEGYFENEEYDAELLRATIVANAYMKMRYWHETNRLEDVKKLQTYLRRYTCF